MQKTYKSKTKFFFFLLEKFKGDNFVYNTKKGSQKNGKLT